MSYIPRPLGARIVTAHSNVVVLEGARAVGKTMLAKKEIVRPLSTPVNRIWRMNCTNISSAYRCNSCKKILIDYANR